MTDHKKLGYKVYKKFLDTRILQEIKHDSVWTLNNLIGSVFKGFSVDQLPISFEERLQLLFKFCPKALAYGGKDIQNNPMLYGLCNDPSLLALIKRDWGIEVPRVATKPVLLFNNKNLAKNEFYWRIPPHKDFYSMSGSLNSIVLWAPLVPKTKPVGSLEVIPGSHLTECKLKDVKYNFGLEDCDESKFVPLDLELGDLVIFSSLLTHRSGDNQDDTAIRWSISLRFSDASCQNWLDRNLEHHYTYSAETKMDCYKPSPEEMRKVYGI